MSLRIGSKPPSTSDPCRYTPTRLVPQTACAFSTTRATYRSAASFTRRTYRCGVADRLDGASMFAARWDMTNDHDATAVFHDLHTSGCFVMPNPWDAGSAVALEQLGFKALATTSSGFAWTMGLPDNNVALDQVIVHLTAIVEAVSVPVNADFEGGYAVEPDGRRGQRDTSSGDRDSWALDRGLLRRRVRPVVRLRSCGGTSRCRPEGDRRQRYAESCSLAGRRVSSAGDRTSTRRSDACARMPRLALTACTRLVSASASTSQPLLLQWLPNR